MFIRWKKKKRVKKYSGDGVTLSAYLVESQRDNGKIKQKIILYLGSIRSDHIKSTHRKEKFWEAIIKNLNETEIPERDRNNLMAKVEETVPRPTPEETNGKGIEVREKLKQLSKTI